MYDCEDLVNGYQCNINIPKLLAVIACPLIALIVIVYVFRRYILKLKYTRLSRSRYVFKLSIALSPCWSNVLHEI
ncbi:hypothetical protein DPMN_125674 [Dreissena polymorpha]|uniref:Uncharacterized protein n=1 Tax=Dreissena polymorpha TaxID=45954 RepID=A0A9D4JTR9_DREPO|nr:hypothetical protein DPMN_125674 [Dreissena polymorpha]